MGMQNLKTIFLACILVLLAACSEKAPNYDERLTDVYDILATTSNADSALNILREMRVGGFSEEHNRAYYAYLYTVCLYWLNAHAEDDELIKIAVDYYSEKGDSAMRAKVFTYAAKVYESVGERQKAVEFYNRALEATPNDSTALKSVIYSYWAFMINNDTPNEEALELYENAKRYAEKSGNMYSVIDAWVQQGWNYLENHNYNRAINCYEKAEKLAIGNELEELRFYPLYRMALAYSYKGDYEKAKSYAEEAQSLTKTVGDNKRVNSTLANIYMNLGNYDEALKYIELSVDTINNLGNALYYRQKWNLFYKKGDYKQACINVLSLLKYNQLLYHERLEDNAAMYQKKYDKTKVMLENAELEVDNKHLETMLLLLVIVVSVFTMFAVMIAYRRRMIVANREKAKDEAMSGLTDQLQGKIIELQEVRLQLAERENDVNDSRQEMLVLREQILGMNAVVQKIKELKKTKTADLYGKKSVLGEDELTVLMEALDTCYNGALSRLKEAVPNISKDELNMCCLVCLNVPLSKAALLLGTSEETLRQRKYRFRHTKLSLPEGTTVDEFVRSFLQ